MVLSDLHTNMPPDDCHWTLLKICQHWFRDWLGAVKPQAISWANVDLILCCHLVSLGCNELNIIVWSLNHCFKSMVATGTCWIVSLRITIVPSCKIGGCIPCVMYVWDKLCLFTTNWSTCLLFEEARRHIIGCTFLISLDALLEKKKYTIKNLEVKHKTVQ